MEIVDIYNNKRRKTNRGQINQGDYGLSVHTWIMNKNNEILIQKRDANKKHFPNLWSQTGGGVIENEDTIMAAIRECKEELGINIDEEKMELVMTIKREDNFLDIYLVKQEFKIEDMILQKGEVADVKWVKLDEFEEMMKRGEVAKSVMFYWELFRKCIENRFRE